MKLKIFLVILSVAILIVIVYFIYKNNNKPNAKTTNTIINDSDALDDSTEDLNEDLIDSRNNEELIKKFEHKVKENIFDCSSSEYSIELAKALSRFDDLRRVNEKFYNTWEQDKSNVNWNNFQMALVDLKNQAQAYNEFKSKCFFNGPFLSV